MSLFISILVVLSTWFLFQASFVWLRQRRRVAFTTINTEPIREVVDSIPLIVTSTKRYLNLPPNQPVHAEARMVITEQWLIVASDKGVLIRADRGSGLKLKSMGEGRWMLLGRSPNGQAELRIVLLPSEEGAWVESLQLFCTH